MKMFLVVYERGARKWGFLKKRDNVCGALWHLAK